jgi:hypothetical protein
VALAHPLDAPSLPVPPTEPVEEGAMVGVGSGAPVPYLLTGW